MSAAVRRALLASVFAAAAMLITSTGADADAEELDVGVRFAAFAPTQVDALPGDTVVWANGSGRAHTVTADDGAFDSGQLEDGAVFSVRLDAVGARPYHCTIHPGMVGVVDVRRVTLEALPSAAVPAGTRVRVSGRTADGATPVVVERAGAHGGFAAVASASPGPDGRWTASVPAVVSGDLRAVAGPDSSETRRLLVSDRHVTVRPTGTGVRIHVAPALPYGRLLIERWEPARFGWWPVRRARLDYVSRATIGLTGRRSARIRVLLVDRDGWTPLATSAAVTLRAAPAAR